MKWLNSRLLSIRSKNASQEISLMMIFLSSSNMMGIEKLKIYRLNAKNQKT